MTGLLTGLSGHLPRKILFSTFFPSVLAVVVGMVALPSWREALQRPGGLGVFGEGAGLELGIILVLGLTALLFVVNVPVIRVYEGYPWQSSWIGTWMVSRQNRRLDEIRSEEVALGGMVRALLRRNRRDPRIPALRRKRDELTRRRLNEFPKASSVLPTRLGNVIRAFESYPQRQYAMAGIELWPRLSPLLPKNVATGVDGARSNFDLVVNASVLSFVLSVGGLLELMGAGPGPGEPYRGLAVAGVSLLAGVGFYRASIGQAKSWGRTVKAAFDLGRRDLLKSLGFEAELVNLEDERRLWRQVSQRVVYLDAWHGSPPSLRYSEPRPPTGPSATASSQGVALDVARGLERIESRRLEVVLRIANPTEERLESVEIRDPLPEGWGYGWGSAKMDGGYVEVKGTAPLCFRVDAVESKESVEIRYEMVRAS